MRSIVGIRMILNQRNMKTDKLVEITKWVYFNVLYDTYICLYSVTKYYVWSAQCEPSDAIAYWFT